jgi:hypothetical protein
MKSTQKSFVPTPAPIFVSVGCRCSPPLLILYELTNTYIEQRRDDHLAMWKVLFAFYFTRLVKMRKGENKNDDCVEQHFCSQPMIQWQIGLSFGLRNCADPFQHKGQQKNEG